MTNQNLLVITYQRVISSEEVVLTSQNCKNYGYEETTIEINGVKYQAFKKENSDEVIEPTIVDGKATTTILNEKFKEYRHVAPPCSKYNISYADVDKEGSGRNSLTGEMFRERIGNYCMLDVAWDLIPNSKQYNTWYTILTSLPPCVNLEMLMPDGSIATKKMYRGDVSTNLYLFIKNAQIWQGLSTTFTQWDVEPYDDNLEQTTQYLIYNDKTGEEKYIYDYEWDEYRQTKDWVIIG